MKRGVARTINGLGVAGALAVAAMCVSRKSPETLVRERMASPETVAAAIPCSDPMAPTLGCHASGMVVPIPTWAQNFKLVESFPGGYTASAEGAVAFPTEIPSVTPTATVTPCRDSDNPCGVPGADRYYCYDCAGSPVCMLTLSGCVPFPTKPTAPTSTRTPTQTPTRTRTPTPTPDDGLPTRPPPRTVPFRPTPG